MVIDCMVTSVPGRFFLKSGMVSRRASLATSHEATVMPPPAAPPPPHPAAPRSAVPAMPAPPSRKNSRRLMPPLTHLTFLPVDKPSPFCSLMRVAADGRGSAHSYADRRELMC